MAAVLMLPALAGAQQVRAGAEFQANTYTTGEQRLPDVLIQPSGEFIVAWTGVDTTLDGSAYGIIAKRFDVLGNPLGSDFRVNSYTPGYQFRPVVGGDARGNFVVVWSSDQQDGSYYGVFGQRYDANGTPAGAEFQVNTFAYGGQGASYFFAAHNHAVSVAPNGNFVVVWGSYYPGQDGDTSSVHGQRFAATGARVGAEFQINTYTTGHQLSPSVALSPDGSFVVVWATQEGPNLPPPNTAPFNVSGQRYDASGNRLGGEFLVNSSTTGNQQAPVVKVAPNGEFTVTFFDNGDVAARRFLNNGTPIGPQFVVNTTTALREYNYSSGMDSRGNFVVNWNSVDFPVPPGTPVADVFGRRFRADGTAREPESMVPATVAGLQLESAVTSDAFGNVLSAWTDVGRDGDSDGVFVQRFGGLRPAALDADPAGNRVIDPGEFASVVPSWRNVNGLAQTFGGTLSTFAGPAGVTYTISDGTATYGTVAHDTVAACTDCYTVHASNPPTRPQTHIDATAWEQITPDNQGQVKQWLLHIGGSFTDVSPASPFYRFIETLLHHSVTGGCTTTTYCPLANTSREQMAVFVLVGKEGPAFSPPACGATTVFADVPASSPFCRWIEELERRQVVSGCGGGNYCPTADVTREQMSVFVLRTLDSTLNPPACVAGSEMFDDVPASGPFCRWIEELARRQVVTGCGGGNYCPIAPVTREQMGVFISVTFGLTLYGV